MKYRSIISTCLLTLSMSTYALAQDDINGQLIAGFGGAPCERWTTGREFNDENVNRALVGWVQGFLSGMNVAQSIHIDSFADLPDSTVILDLMDEGCSNDQSESVYNIALKVYLYLYAN